MLSEKYDHLEKAKALLAAGDPDSLRYCCLELRTCIELIAYERIPLFEKELPKGFEKWQPKEVIEALVDCDPDAEKDFTLAMGLDGPGGAPPKQMHVMGSFVAITKKFVQRHYHKLGAYLHAPTYAQIQARNAPDPDKEFLEETIKQVGLLCSSTMNANFGPKVTLVCEDCGTTIVRNTEALKRDGKLRCLDPACGAVYSVEDIDTPVPQFRIIQIDYTCFSCGARIFVGHHKLRDGLRIKCHTCNAAALVKGVWNVTPIPATAPSPTPQAPATPPPEENAP